MNNILITIIGFSIIFLMTTFGASLVFFFKKDISQSINSFLLGIAGGIMVAASIWSLIIPAIASIIFVTSKAISSQGKTTTSVNTYVSENSRNNTTDDSFIRKTVSSTRISTSSSSGGGVTRSGGGGGGGGGRAR